MSEQQPIVYQMRTRGPKGTLWAVEAYSGSYIVHREFCCEHFARLNAYNVAGECRRLAETSNAD